MERISKQYSFLIRERHLREYPTPFEVVNSALEELRPDGSVLKYDDEQNKYFKVEARELVHLNDLPVDSYAKKLLYLARQIQATVAYVHEEPERVEDWIQGLAHTLSAYRHSRAFIQYAASMVYVDKLSIRPPRLPPGRPLDWVPGLRLKLMYQNELLED